MDIKLQEITDKFYTCKGKSGIIYTLKKGARGVCGAGKACFLHYIVNGVQETAACFTYEDDGRRVYREDYGHKLWDISAIIDEANVLINKLEEIYK